MWARIRHKLSFLRRRTRDRVARDLAEELDLHRQLLERDQTRRGMDEAAAGAAARRQLGHVTVAQDESRDAWMFLGAESVVRDLTLALRACRRNPAFAITAMVTLALGIGANAAVFHVLDTVVLRPLAARDPGALVRLQGLHDGTPVSFSYPLFDAVASAQTALTTVFASTDLPDATVTLAGSDPIPGVRVRIATGGFFDGLGVHARLGRTFGEADDRPMTSPVAVLSDAFWQRTFPGHPDVGDQQVRINGVPVAVVGVMDPEFVGDQVGALPDLWVPMRAASMLSAGWVLQPSSAVLSPMGRLRLEIPRARAEVMLNALYRQLRAVDLQIAGTKDISLVLEPGAQGLAGIRRDFASPLWILMGAVGLMVVMACCNLASLLLARAVARQQEMHVRVALGASRSRLMRQLVTESLLLSALGGLLGLVPGGWASRQIVRLGTAGSGWHVALGTDWRVVAFGFGLSIVTACLFGLAPAFLGTREAASVHVGDRSGGPTRSHLRAAKTFVVAQVAMSVILVATASVLGRSFWNLTHQDFGYQPDHVLFIRLSFDAASIKAGRDLVVDRALVDRLGALPGVRSAALAGAGPLGAIERPGRMAVPGRPAVKGDDVRFVSVSPQYFDAMGIPLVAGRSITEADGVGSPAVAVISETAARTVFGGGLPIGRFFSDADRFDTGRPVEVVGVAHDLRFSDPRDPFGVVVYQPLAQSPSVLTSVVLRTAGDPGLVAKAADQVTREVAPALRISDVAPLRQDLWASLSRDEMLTVLSSTFGTIALLLAGVGLYGVTAYGVSERRREIGVRLALGASPTRVVAEVLREVGGLLALGFVLGAVVLTLFGRVLASVLFGLSPLDPTTLGVSGAVLAATAMCAAYLAARRAAAVDPMHALGHG